jgi:hypothetical protein
MTTSTVQVQETITATYEQMLQKGMAVACFLFPLLYLVSAVYYLTNNATFNTEAGAWVGDQDVELYRWLHWTWFAMIPAMVGLTRLLKEKRPRQAFWGVVFALIGGLHQVGGHRMEIRLAELRELGFEVYWNTGGIARSPLDFIGLLVLLWMIGMIMLGIASWRTGVLPKWVGGLIALGAFAFFLYQGPGGVIEALPPIAYQVAGLCFLLSFPVVGMKLWRGETESQSKHDANHA